MKRLNVFKKSSKFKTKLITMLVVGCSIISQFASIPAYAGTNADRNIALGKTATASSYCGVENPSKAVNGTYSNLSDKWCSGDVSGEKWLKLDLGSNYNINRWVVYHAGVVESDPNYVTRDFRLQKSNDGRNWTDVDTVIGNGYSYTERRVTTFQTRYVRLYIDCGQRYNNNVARIFEFQLYYDPAINLADYKTVSASKQIYTQEADKAVNGSSYDKWCTGSAYGESKWLTVDLGRVYTINRWRILHAGLRESASYNTKNFRLQASFNGVDWQDVDVVTNNTSNITDRIIYGMIVSGRYFRLWIDQSTQYDDSCARIYEFQLYNTCYTSYPNNLALGKATYASSYANNREPSRAVDGSLSGTRLGISGDSMWATDYGYGNNSWMTVDLGSTCTINKWVVISGDFEWCNGGYYNDAFRLQASNDNVNWTDIDVVSRNFSTICSRKVNDFSARYVRLYIDKSCHDNSARVTEFELYYE